MTNCPNCGAARTGPKCDYCGTVFEKPDNRRISELKLETELVEKMINTQRLYTEAINAMRDYARCC